MSTVLPFDVIVDILLRLPVKSILRCRSVAKRWRSTIDDPDFHRNQVCRSKSVLKLNPNPSLFVRYHSKIYKVMLDLGSNSIPDPEDLNYPLMCYSDQIKILGSSNGLVVIKNAADDIVIWNPAMKRHRFLPSFPVGYSGTSVFSVTVYGFGYDDAADDYVLVRLVQFFTDPFEFELSLYGVRKNKWRRSENLSMGSGSKSGSRSMVMAYSLVYPHKMGVYAGGCLHWVMTRDLKTDEASFIVAFDFGIEDFKEVELPEVSDWKFDMDVGVLGGCLCMIANYQRVGVDLWMMKEYGVKSSWVKLFSVPVSDIGVNKFVRPLIYSEQGDWVLVHGDDEIFRYELDSKRVVQRKKISGVPSFKEVEIYHESLISLDKYGTFYRKKKDQEEINDVKKRDDFLSVGFKLTL